jgi:predicted phosphoadenosine phosphosulfate sulfurtransferase
MKFWNEKGGVLSNEVIQKLTEIGIKFEIVNNTNYKTNKKPVKMEYLDDINIKEFKLIPSYKRMCISIMKNDHQCKYLGFLPTKNELDKRQETIKKYKELL